jgi:hypothetical protein
LQLHPTNHNPTSTMATTSVRALSMKASFAGAKVQTKSTVKAAVPMKAKCVPALPRV